MLNPSRYTFTFKLTAGILAIFIPALAAITLINLGLVKTSLHAMGENSLVSLAQGARATMEMQHRLLESQTRADLDLFMKQIQSKGFPGLNRMLDVSMTVSGPRITTRVITLPVLQIGSHDMTGSTELVDEFGVSVSAGVSVYQFHDDLLINVSTNLKVADGSRPTGQVYDRHDQIYQSIVHRDETHQGVLDIGGELFQTASMPLKDFSGRLIGMISTSRRIVTPELESAIAAFARSGRGEGMLLAQDGRILTPSGGSGTQTLAGQSFWRLLVSSASGLVRYDDDGVSKVALLERFEPWNLFYLFWMDSEGMALGLDKKLAKYGLFMAFLAILPVIAVVVLMVRAVTGPLKELSKFTEEVSTGNYAATIRYEARDVIAETIAAAQRMVFEIRNRLSVSEGILQGIPLPCAVVDKDHRVTWFNPQMLAVLGKNGETSDHLGQSPGQFFWNDPGRETQSDRSLRFERQQEGEIDYRNAKGEKKIIRVTSTPFRGIEGETLGTLSVWLDLTGYLNQKEFIEQQHRAMQETAVQAEQVASGIAEAAKNLSSQVEFSRKGSELQFARAREVAQAMVEMNSTVADVARNAGETARNAEGTRKMALEGSERVRSVMAAIKNLEKRSMELKCGMSELSGQVVSIGRIMQMIDDIADQTNLLALNAAIEAARAGESGRGFAVVADEVRKLAEKTMAATKEVGEYISAIQVGTKKNTDATEAALKEVLHSTGLAESSGRALEEIVGMAERTAGQVSSIAAATEQHSAASDQISRASEEISVISSENSTAMDRCSVAVAVLAGLSSQLEETIHLMKREQETPERPTDRERASS
jgi:methyl-accepting chemotaxis protein